MKQVEIFTSSTVSKLQEVINEWLKEHSDKVIEDIKYSSAVNHYSALILYCDHGIYVKER